MQLKELVSKSRARRRFDENYKLDKQVLLELVDLARLTPSSLNLQPLKYYISNTATTNAIIFKHLVWGGYLKDWPGPAVGERPTGYIIIVRDLTITKLASCDHGIAAQTIMLGATEKGLGGCIHSSINKTAFQKALNIPEQYEVLLVLSLGKPAETVVIDPVKDENIKYWRDDADVHHVPKRNLEEIILNLHSK